MEDSRVQNETLQLLYNSKIENEYRIPASYKFEKNISFCLRFWYITFITLVLRFISVAHICDTLKCSARLRKAGLVWLRLDFQGLLNIDQRAVEVEATT